MLSLPEMNLISSFLFSSEQLEYALHLLLSPVSFQPVSTVQLAFEMIYNPLDLVNTVVKPAFFVILHLQDPSLQCFPLSHDRNASVIGGRTSRHTNFSKSIHIFSDRILVVISRKSFLYLTRIFPKIPVKLNSSGLEVFRLDRFGLNRFGLITCERWDLC